MTARRAARRAAAIATAVVVGSASAHAQRVDPERPRTLTVGLPASARMDRFDAGRTGGSLPLPRSSLRVAWRTALGTYVERAPVVDARGGSYVVGARGDVVALGPGGAVRWRVATGATQPGPAALLSDDTVVFADAGGLAVAVRDGAVRWRVRFARTDMETPSPLPLEDGGVVVATTRELVLLDADGNERTRVTLPEPATGPLLWSAGRVVAIGATGSVWLWTPGAVRAERVGAFGAPVDAGAALLDDRTLIAVIVRDATLRTLDLASASTTVRATSSRALWRGPPAVADGVAFVASAGSTGQQVTAIDPSGEEIARAVLATRSSPAGLPSVDAGVAPAPTASPTPAIVDAEGTLAFALSDGAVGVALFAPRGSNGGPDAGPSRSTDGAAPVTVETIADVCPLAFGAAGSSTVRAVAGLAGLPDRLLLAVCRSGAVVVLAGSATSDAPAKAL